MDNLYTLLTILSIPCHNQDESQQYKVKNKFAYTREAFFMKLINN